MMPQPSIQTLEAVKVLSGLIQIPSFSREENLTADYLAGYLMEKNVDVQRIKNNVWATNKFFHPARPSILINSHHDTVKPNSGYTKNPFAPIIADGRLYGLGSNDAGGCLVCLMFAFLHFYENKDLPFNLIFAATAEEEISGKNGIELLLQQPEFAAALSDGKSNEIFPCAIVGEPTKMQLAVAEKGLMVLDCKATGRAGHAARDEGENAIYKAIKDIAWLEQYRFEKVSELLGPVKLSVTAIETINKAHNVVPDSCGFVVDVRINELYTVQEVLQTLQQNMQSEIIPRSTRLRSSSISLQHPLVRAGLHLGKTYYGSPTTSDKALMPFPSLKMGPGDSARSHTVDEFIFIAELEEGIDGYVKLLGQLIG